MDQILAVPALERLVRLYGRPSVKVQAGAVLQALREEMAAGGVLDLEAALEGLPDRVEAGLRQRLGAPLRRVLNATGILIHTNLGRSPLPPDVASALPALLDAYCDLELDLETGQRGDRNRRVESLLRAATGAPAALVVNNNAAALLLALATLCGGSPAPPIGESARSPGTSTPPAILRTAGRRVVVSRGELVEIGGSFRIPEILAAAGAELVEVGTTNRTRLADYARAIDAGAALLLKIFPSNYRISGFVESVAAEALVDLGRRRGVPVLIDEGSGLLRPHPATELRDHRSLSELIALGADLACGSGDKLLGGPQAGLLVGAEARIRACARHPLYRALRPDRITLAALELVLRRHLAEQASPLSRMWPDPDEHARRVRSAAAALGADTTIVLGYLGGGSAPEQGIPAEAVVLPQDDALLARLRLGEPSVVAYQKDGRLVLDLRTLDPSDDADLIAAVARALASPGGLGGAGDASARAREERS